MRRLPVLRTLSACSGVTRPVRQTAKNTGDFRVVENRRVVDGRVVQRHVLYLGEINDAQRAAWCRAMAVFDEDAGATTPLARFPEDRPAPELAGGTGCNGTPSGRRDGRPVVRAPAGGMS